MSSSIPGSLPKADQDVVRRLLKSLHATKYDEPVDQGIFLLESANTLLRFRPYLALFALLPDLGECAFTLRSLMHVNNVRLGAPPSDTFISLKDFVGDMIRKRQVFRERQSANADRARVAGGIAVQLVRNVTLEYASNMGKKAPASPDDDAVSIPSSSDESGIEEAPRLPTSPPPSLVTAGSVTAQPSSQVGLEAVLLSPIGELGFCLARLSMGPPLLKPHPLLLPSPPFLSSPSLPDLVPDFSLGKYRFPVKGGGSRTGSATFIRPDRLSSATPFSWSLVRSARLFSTRSPITWRLAAVQAEIRRLSIAQKELFWQLQTIRQSKLDDPPLVAQKS
ncbi:hypothetical protein B0H10DRAFT_2211568 [Mycena sp. CBHHK59/15]|nr:hypothetical protein B0H10DRAFT_2211568 [Mycena sp. CBHHK59/15]